MEIFLIYSQVKIILFKTLYLLENGISIIKENKVIFDTDESNINKNDEIDQLDNVLNNKEKEAKLFAKNPQRNNDRNLIIEIEDEEKADENEDVEDDEEENDEEYSKSKEYENSENNDNDD
jgi:hypothetical protein